MYLRTARKNGNKKAINHYIGELYPQNKESLLSLYMAIKNEAEADIPGFRRDKEEKKERPPRSPYEYLWNEK